MKTTARMLSLSLALSLSANSFACVESGKEGIVPENKMYIPVDAKTKGGLTEEQFNAALDKAETIYAPIVEQHGGKLQVVRNWTDGTVNAYASRSGNTWTVQMFGGLARHETITEDGMTLVICHELGHHLGGAPKKGGGGGWWGGGSASWASNEGQADYFATMKCLRRAFLHDDNSAILARMEIPAALTAGCQKAWPNKVDSDICVRGGMAGQSVANLFRALSNDAAAPDFTTPDTKVVSRTDDNHPATQCRLDTYFQGAICEVLDSVDFDDKDEKAGACHPSTGSKIGNRPLCWFKPAAQ